jgi:hypothetical protein
VKTTSINRSAAGKTARGGLSTLRLALPFAALASAAAGCRSGATNLPLPQPPSNAESPNRQAGGLDRLYLAALTAAELSLRLHETDRAKYWLEQTAVQDRGWEWGHLAALVDQSTAQFHVGHGTVRFAPGADMSVQR